MALPLTVLDIHRLIDQDVQRLAHLAYKNLETEEIDLQINRQIGILINGILDKFFGRALKINEEQGFQKDQVSLDNLRNLHVRGASATIVPGTQEVSFDLPPDYYHHIKTIVTISYKCYENGAEITKTEDVAVRITESQYDKTHNPFHKTGRDSPLAEIAGSKMYVITDDTFSITAAKVSYIKKPAVVTYVKTGGGDYDPTNSVQCDLDSSLHYMLVDMVSIRIMKTLESPQQKIVNFQQETI